MYTHFISCILIRWTCLLRLTALFNDSVLTAEVTDSLALMMNIKVGLSCRLFTLPQLF